MTQMNEKEQLETVGGVECPLCGAQVHLVAYPVHGWMHIFEEVGSIF